MRLTKPQTLDLTEWALWYASRGWLVFPLCSPQMGQHRHKKDGPLCDHDIGKAPMVGAGFKVGTCDPAQIKAWWSKWPTANIGATPPKDWVVVDVDGDTDVNFPETLTHSSGKGKHLVYIDNITKPLPHGNKIWPNVDTRVHGKGYVVLPPSMHQSGNRYEVINDLSPVVFPAELVPDKRTIQKRQKAADSEIVRLLTMPRDANELGDDAMSKVAGWVARYAPDLEHFEALLHAINMGLAEPLSPPAMAKKRGIWEKHIKAQEEKAAKALDDESRGWLYELGETGYSTPIERSGGSVDYVPFSDFRVTARGLITLPDNQVWIVDFHRSDGSTLEGQRLSAVTLASTARLREWLLRRGMVLHDNRADKRTAYGARLAKLLQSQDPPVWKSRDHYGWCEETGAFLLPEGEVTSEGLRAFTGVYPEDELVHSAPTAFKFDAELEQARDWFKRLLALQNETESVKIGAWLMMLWLRGQWHGRLPGIIVEASAGVGKTLFFQLFSKLAGSTNDGEHLTLASARDMLSGNPSGFVWFDDVATDAKMEELIRKAITQGRVTLKEKAEGGGWRSTHRQLRGSIVISGEGSDFYRQKAQRDRFVDVEFEVHRSPDAEQLQREGVGRGSGVLLQECLRHAYMLLELDALRDGVTERDKQAQTTLRIGARILDAVLCTGDKYSRLIDDWYFGRAIELDKGQASENVLHVFPSLWVHLGYPKAPGSNGLVFPLWYDEVNETFWVNGKKVAEAWNERKNVNERQRQLTSPTNVNRELDACEASRSVSKRVPGEKLTPAYRQLPKRYSQLVLQAADVYLEDVNSND